MADNPSQAVLQLLLTALETIGAGVPGIPELVNLVQSASGGPVTRAAVDRALLSLMMANPDLRKNVESLPQDYQDFIQSLLSGTMPVAPPSTHPQVPTVAETRAKLKASAATCPDILEGDGTPMVCVSHQTFQNWGRTVQNTPASTYIPKTKTGVCNLVKWAQANNKRVRVSGYRHTWGDLYSADDQVLISLLPLDVVEDLPAQEPPINPLDELQGIEIVGTIVENDVTKALCKIGSATTNEQFRRWCLSDRGGNWNWTVPLNVIMVEITWGGSNAPICHGAGWRNQTLSDLVTEVEFVNVNGVLQTVSDPQQLKAAAGCFGLLGVVTAITLKLDPMTFAAMRPKKRPVPLTIPPPSGFPVPPEINMSGITPQQLDAAWQDFVDRCENDYYAEWFWFPYQPQCWINTWKNDGLRQDAKDYPSPLDSFVQWLEEWIAECINNWPVFQALPGAVQGFLLGLPAMSQMPDVPDTDPPITAPLIDALHFRRGIQNMRVLDMELEIPIPARADDPTKPDWSVCQKAWWDAIAAVYNSLPDGPMRIALEMRIMADSAISMAPQYGNSFGTCSIEVLTNLNDTQEEWQSFMQLIADKWTSYIDAAGQLLNVRPHWAKQWQEIKFHNIPAAQYLKDVAYRDRIPEFKSGLLAVAQAGGYTLQALQQRFSNALLDDIFEHVFVSAAGA